MPRKIATTKPHPAPYSMELIAVFRKLLAPGTRVHDPFAGGGERLGQLADELGLIFTGGEIEPEFISDPRVTYGNATMVEYYPPRYMTITTPETDLVCVDVGFTIVTSPVYPNGIADHFHAQDSSRRRTYRGTLAKITGYDKPLDPDNQGRWGYRGTPLHSPSRAQYWSIAQRSIEAWTAAGAERVLLNASDFCWQKVTEPVVAGWLHRLESCGWRLVKAHKVFTPRDGLGNGQKLKAEYEVILDMVRAA